MMCWETSQSGGNESHEGMVHWMGTRGPGEA